MSVNFTGQAHNPLESELTHIQWNVSITVNRTGGAYTGQVFVSGGVTCYPSHQIIVNDTVVAYFTAMQNPTIAYLTGCLLSQGPAFPLIGPAIQPGGTPVTAE
jgi:hypothetical protein